MWVEVGPGRTLASLLRQAGGGPRTVVTSLRHPHEATSDLAHLLATLGRLWLSGVSADGPGYYAGERRRRIPLPTYPFERRRYWLDLQPAALAADASPRALIKSADIASWFYTPAWTRAEAPRAEPRAAGGVCLVFADEAGLGTALAERLRREGQAAVCVQAGARFSVDGPDAFTLAPSEAEGYVALLDRLDGEGRLPRQIVHAWSLDAPHAGPGNDAFARAQDRGFYSLLFLVQALGRRRPHKPVDITVVGDRLHRVGAADAVSPEQSPAIGLCLVIAQEYPRIRCGSLEIRDVTPDRLALLAAQVDAEVAGSPDGVPVAYRDNDRFVQTWNRVALGPSADSLWLRDRGVYLITGGLGSIGLAMADRLARAVRARLVLVGRTALPRDAWQAWLDTHDAADARSRQIAAVQALEAQGAEVLVAAADVADRDQMRRRGRAGSRPLRRRQRRDSRCRVGSRGYRVDRRADARGLRASIPAEGARPRRARSGDGGSPARLLPGDVVAVGAARRPRLRRVRGGQPVPRHLRRGPHARRRPVGQRQLRCVGVRGDGAGR